LLRPGSLRRSYRRRRLRRTRKGARPRRRRSDCRGCHSRRGGATLLLQLRKRGVVSRGALVEVSCLCSCRRSRLRVPFRSSVLLPRRRWTVKLRRRRHQGVGRVDVPVRDRTARRVSGHRVIPHRRRRWRRRVSHWHRCVPTGAILNSERPADGRRPRLGRTGPGSRCRRRRLRRRYWHRR